ncbi:suppressor of fused domain protein [Sphaerisporangium aureirubrum]|uniref:Suppressor of fused domain protein n=1 Tax=Sphaerisporangium aureirubrum TaxID=1544736 RepID=A0ABW1NR95_9ACTN
MGTTDVILTDTSPYGSRAVTVETDGVSSVAYLRDAGGGVHGAVWLANHGNAPASSEHLDPADLWRSPVMPGSATRVPEGSAPPAAGELDVLWFEEGDGAALYRNGELLAVIPGWADLERGMPGYARDAIGESPLAWSLTEALEGLAPRIAKARSYWEWRAGDGSWPSFQQFAMSHLDARVGPADRYWDIGGDTLPTVGITERPRDGYTVLSTIGMSCQRMPTVEQYIEQPDAFARIELALATRVEVTEAAQVLLWLARYPWQSVTWLGHGHTAGWYGGPGSFPLGTDYEGVVLLNAMPGLPDLSGFAFGGDEVRWLWTVPITGTEMRIATEQGHERLSLGGRIP